MGNNQQTFSISITVADIFSLKYLFHNVTARPEILKQRKNKTKPNQATYLFMLENRLCHISSENRTAADPELGMF